MLAWTRDHLHRWRVLAVDLARSDDRHGHRGRIHRAHRPWSLIKAAVAAKVLPLAWKVYFTNTSKY
jgi:hypothetical protein